MTVDSGLKTVSGGATKCSKNDMSGSATDINPANFNPVNLSNSDIGTTGLLGVASVKK